MSFKAPSEQAPSKQAFDKFSHKKHPLSTIDLLLEHIRSLGVLVAHVPKGTVIAPGTIPPGTIIRLLPLIGHPSEIYDTVCVRIPQNYRGEITEVKSGIDVIGWKFSDQVDAIVSIFDHIRVSIFFAGEDVDQIYLSALSTLIRREIGRCDSNGPDEEILMPETPISLILKENPDQCSDLVSRQRDSIKNYALYHKDIFLIEKCFIDCKHGDGSLTLSDIYRLREIGDASLLDALLPFSSRSPAQIIMDLKSD